MKTNAWLKFSMVSNTNDYEIVLHVHDIKSGLIVSLHLYYWDEVLNRLLA